VAVAGARVLTPDRGAILVDQLAGQEVVVRGRLYEDPDPDENRMYRARLRDLTICARENECYPANANLFVMFRVADLHDLGEVALERGDTITVRGQMRSGFGAFAGSMYRATVIDHAKSNPPDRFLQVRNWFSAGVEAHIPAPESSLALGYMLGQKRALPAALLNVLAITGLTHIVVASGANLTIITRILRRLFRRSRLGALVVALLAVGFMVGVIGMVPSLVRASIVSVLALLAWYMGRPAHPARLIVLAAATTLVFNPTFILDMGWQLSFAAFGGVLLLAPVLTRFFYGEEKPRALAQIVIETVAATILTLPILLYSFGYISLLAILPNLLILPTIPLAMLLSFATGVFAIFWAPLAALFGGLAGMVLRYHIAVINLFGEMDFALLEVDMSLAQAVVAYAVILVGWGVVKWRSKTRLLEVNIIEWEHERAKN
jgi:competence protein ComEC